MSSWTGLGRLRRGTRMRGAVSATRESIEVVAWRFSSSQYLNDKLQMDPVVLQIACGMGDVIER